MTRWKTTTSPTEQEIVIGTDKTRVTVAQWPKQPSVLDELNGTRNVRYMERAAGVLSGRWTVVSFYDLTTACWDGQQWTHIVTPDRGKAAGIGDRVDAMATCGDRAWAVSTGGAVFAWTGDAWGAECVGGGQLFAKQRRFTSLIWEASAERLVLWGGKNGNRPSNDTLFFEAGAWRKAKKSSQRPAALKARNFWLAPTSDGVVRVGSDGVHRLQGERWEDLGHCRPPFVSPDADASSGQLLIAAAADKLLLVDPLTGKIYEPGGEEPLTNVDTAPGLVSLASLKEQGAYFHGDFASVNEGDWMWGWNCDTKTVFGMCLGSPQSVCTLDLSSLY